MTIRQRRTYWTAAGVVLATLAIGLLAAGGGKAATKSTAPPPPEVGVIHVMGEDVSTYRGIPPAPTHAISSRFADDRSVYPWGYVSASEETRPKL